jgi:hypothetical protein
MSRTEKAAKSALSPKQYLPKVVPCALGARCERRIAAQLLVCPARATGNQPRAATVGTQRDCIDPWRLPPWTGTIPDWHLHGSAHQPERAHHPALTRTYVGPHPHHMSSRAHITHTHPHTSTHTREIICSTVASPTRRGAQSIILRSPSTDVANIIHALSGNVPPASNPPPHPWARPAKTADCERYGFEGSRKSYRRRSERQRYCR